MLGHKTNNPAEALVIYSLLQSGGFHPIIHNYYYGFISIAELIALDGLRIMLPESEVCSAREFIANTQPISDCDPIPERPKRDILQASILTLNPFFFVYHLPLIYQCTAFICVVIFHVFAFSLAPTAAVLANIVFAFLILVVAHAKHIALPRLRHAHDTAR